MSNLFEPEARNHYRLYAQVALERGLEKAEGLTYGVLPELAEGLRVGDRVRVPLGKGNKPASGYVLELNDSCPMDAARVKALAGKIGQSVNLPADLLELARWVARYYCCPIGMVLAAMLPASVRKGTGLVRTKQVKLAEPLAIESVADLIEKFKLRDKQAAALRAAIELRTRNELPVEIKALADLAGARSVACVRSLIKKGVLDEVVKMEVRAVWREHAAEPPNPITLNSDQQHGVQAITRSLGGGFAAHLLLGVTGSGKTEVYIRAIEAVVAAGKRAIVLVPEISLTPQTVGRFIGRFARVAVLHSGLTASQRHEQWGLIREGWPQVVVGARSAVFAPVADLGLIIVDEEHDASYKQDQAPRYHARDVAVKRAQSLGATVVLGTATPSLESYHNATHRGVYNLLELPRRVSEQPLPHVELVDMTEERRKRYEHTGSRGFHLLSLRLEKSVQKVVTDGGQVILLLNRRGFANFIACPDAGCGWIKTCEHCDVAMVYHKDAALPHGGLVRCHYCSYENLLPKSCPVCASKVTPFGLGTQRVEEEVARKFPGVEAIRMDSDSMRTADDYRRSLERFREGHARILLGTQMIAKGLDFPNVKLVGVISADTALSMPDFRAAERTFQLVCQVAGRSGRSAGGGRVIVQTFTPDHPAIQFAAKHDYLGFARQELESRLRAELPPYRRMARLVARDKDLPKARQAAEDLAQRLRAENEAQSLHARILGPHPAGIARIAGQYRMQVELFAPNPQVIQKLLGTLRDAGHLISDSKTAVDVDPISLL